MRRSLRRPKVNVNFFFFQDIITAALGVILFIALILALHLEPASDPSAAPSVTPKQIAAEKRLRTLLEQLVQKRQILESLSSKALTTDPKALAKQIEILKTEAAALTSAISAKDAPIPGTDNSQQVDEALQGGKAELAKAQAEAAKMAAELSKVQGQVAELEGEIKDLESRLLAEEQLKNRIWLIPQSSGTSKEPLLITISSSGYDLQRFGKKDLRKTVDGPDVSALLREGLKEYSKNDFYVVLYFKPSGFSSFDAARDTVTTQGYEVGTDVIPEDTTLDFSPPDQ